MVGPDNLYWRCNMSFVRVLWFLTLAAVLIVGVAAVVGCSTSADKTVHIINNKADAEAFAKKLIEGDIDPSRTTVVSNREPDVGNFAVHIFPVKNGDDRIAGMPAFARFAASYSSVP
jgi:hypothetical protein